MLVNLQLCHMLNEFASRFIVAGVPGIVAKLVIENGRHDFYFVADTDTPVGVLFVLLVSTRVDLAYEPVLEYAEQLLGFCDVEIPGGVHV